MPCVKKSTYPIILVLFILFVSCTNHHKTAVTIHYLGHSSVYLDFDGKVSVLCDYGQENAYLAWGWDSPIYDAGEPGPDILCYSHDHADHYDPERAARYTSVIISGETDTVINGLRITGYPASEKDISRFDNYSYLFSYRGVRVLHLGDCQADILMINDPAQAWNIEQRYPKNCDILIMPIQSTQTFIPQAVKMVEMLEPHVLIPTHFWSYDYKLDFLKEIERQFNEKEKPINIIDINRSTFTYTGMKPGLTIPNLIPSARETEDN